MYGQCCNRNWTTYKRMSRWKYYFYHRDKTSFLNDFRSSRNKSISMIQKNKRLICRMFFLVDINLHFDMYTYLWTRLTFDASDIDIYDVNLNSTHLLCFELKVVTFKIVNWPLCPSSTVLPSFFTLYKLHPPPLLYGKWHWNHGLVNWSKKTEFIG